MTKQLGSGADEQAVLRIENLCVETHGSGTPRTIVHDISFDVHAGEMLCVVGESGSGKSVTSMAAMGLLPKASLRISQGAIYLGNENLVTATPARWRKIRASHIAMVFQEPMTALNPVKRIGEQVDEVLRLHERMSRGERRRRVLEMFESVRLPDVERMYRSFPHQLSGGQRQRIVIAMALILKPEVLIADEPTTALDVTTQKQILSLIKELQEIQRTAVVVITHDFGVVAEVADRILVMNQGHVVEAGTRAEILCAPQQAYTKQLLSSVPSLAPVPRAALTSAKVLEVIGLEKHFEQKSLFGKTRRTHALKNVSMSVRRGEILGVVGESGSGKSTLARCIMRLTDCSAGDIFLEDIPLGTLSPQALRPVRKRVQMVFQDPYRSLNPRLKVGESLIEGLLNFGMPRQQAWQKAADAIQFVGLDPEVLHRYPHQFSGGQRQRLCIARAVVMEPDVLVADEAVSALDVTVQNQVLALLEKIRETLGLAVVFITHDLRVAAQVCDTIVVMQRGEIVENGAAATVLTSPSSSYTQALIDAAPARDWDFQNFRALTPLVA